MTTTAASSTHTHDDRALRATAALGLLSGGALVVDTVTIAVINRHFDPLDSLLFLVGFVGIFLTVAALAVHLSSGRRGAARALAGVGVFVSTAAVLGAVSAACDAAGRRVFPASEIGLHGEWSFFSIGVGLLIIATWAVHRQARSRARASTVPNS